VLEGAKGFLVTGVNEGSPADKAGIRGGDKVTNVNGREIRLGGDIVLKIDDQDVRKIEGILTYLERYKHAGDTAQLTILRDGGAENVSVQLSPSSMASRSIESPILPLQPPNDDSNQEQQSQSDFSNSLLNDLHNRSSETLGKSLCDQLFER
jgi:serine protease Do